MSAELRFRIIEAIDEAVASKARLYRACHVICLEQRRLRRWRKAKQDGRTGGYRAKNQKLSVLEKDEIVTALQMPEIKSQPIKVAHAMLMEKGVYFCSPSTLRRVCIERNVRQSQSNTNIIKRIKPELIATGPNQVWCWDITWLNAFRKGTYFYLYMVIDMFTRKVVGWEVYAKESGALAKSFFAQVLESNGRLDGEVKVHADNGKPMRSRCLRSLFDLLNVTASYGRPHTSNDNAFAESLFATLKGRVQFPEYFPTIEAARSFCRDFFHWYNNVHLHSALDYVTPQDVQEGRHLEIFTKRNELLARNRLKHPSRHGGRKKVFGITKEVRLKHKVTLMTTA